MWTELYNRMTISALEGDVLAKPTEKTLAAFEEAHFKLPASYREYAKVFGVGELAGLYRIAVPLDVESEYNLVQHNKDAHGEPSEGLWEAYAAPDVIDKMFFFGATVGGEMFAWNLANITNNNDSEYAICLFRRRPKIEHIASSFDDFVERHCLKNGQDEDLLSFLAY